jgi:hypothetical protein
VCSESIAVDSVVEFENVYMPNENIYTNGYWPPVHLAGQGFPMPLIPA